MTGCRRCVSVKEKIIKTTNQLMSVRLNRVLKEFNIGLQTVVDLLARKGHEVVADLNTKISEEEYNIVKKEFGSDRNQKKISEEVATKKAEEKKQESASTATPSEIKTVLPEQPRIKTVGKVDLNNLSPKAETVQHSQEKTAQKPTSANVSTASQQAVNTEMK